MDNAATENANQPDLPPIICPFLRAAVHEGRLDLDSSEKAKTSQLRQLLRYMSMTNIKTVLSAGVAIFLANRLVDIPGNLIRRKFSPLEMQDGSIKHSCTTTILTKSGNGVFDGERFEKLISASADKVRMTKVDFLRYNAELRSQPGNTSVGAWLNRLEFSLLLEFLGEVDSEGGQFITIASLRNLYQHARLPKNKTPSITGEVHRLEKDKKRPLPGLVVELIEEGLFTRRTLATKTTKVNTAEFEFSLPKSHSDLSLRFIDPRPSMGRDKHFYEVGLGKVNASRNLGVIDLPHWLYDQNVPFPVARVNRFTNKVPQRFTRTMSLRFCPAAVLQNLKKVIIQKFFFSMNLSRLHAVFSSDKTQKELQDDDSDAYFMYRVLNGFNPSTIYLNDRDDSKFPSAMYFLDCDLDGFESDGKHNLISGQLYFDIEDFDSEPFPCGIHLRIRKVADTQRWSEPETELTVTCEDSDEWRIAKQAFRSAWATAGEIDAHLGAGHLNVGQYAIAAYRNLFASPIRQLLLPFLRGVTEINELGSDSIFGESGVLSKCSPLSSKALLARLGSQLGTLDWYEWQPPKPLYATHTYPMAAELYWNVVNELVDDFFSKNETSITENEEEIYRFSVDLVENCLPQFTANHFTAAGVQGNEQVPGNKKSRSIGFKLAQQKYHKHEGLGLYRKADQEQDQASHPLAVSKIENLDDLNHSCKYIIFHATFWHWWTNDLQATDLSNVFWASLGLRNGGYHLSTESLPIAGEAAEQLAFSKLLTSVRIGLVNDKHQGDAITKLFQLLEEKRKDFKDLSNPFELASTFDINNIRSRINI